MTAEMSSKLSGFISRSSERIGPPSSWNTPSVSPRAEQLVRRARSSSARSSSTERMPRFASMLSSASSMIVRLRSPRKSILMQAERLARRVVELRDDLAVLLALHDRDDVDQRLARHDDAGGVHAPLALEVLEADARSRRPSCASASVSMSARNSPASLKRGWSLSNMPASGMSLPITGGRHRLGELLAHAEREAEHAAGVLQRLLGLDRAVGDDLGDALVAVLLGDVLDDLAAATVVEVDVEVGHRDAVGVEEALEDQAVLQRVEVGDAASRTRPSSRRPIRGPGRRGCRCCFAQLMKSATTRK